MQQSNKWKTLSISPSRITIEIACDLDGQYYTKALIDEWHWHQFIDLNLYTFKIHASAEDFAADEILDTQKYNSLDLGNCFEDSSFCHMVYQIEEFL